MLSTSYNHKFLPALFLFGFFLLSHIFIYLNHKHLFMLKISSRTLHIPWDEAGCLCPVGDLFNYAAPTEDTDSFENVENWQNEHAKDDLDIHHSQRLTDGGYEEDVAAYCFYAKKNYNVGEQVPEILSFCSQKLKYILFNKLLYC